MTFKLLIPVLLLTLSVTTHAAEVLRIGSAQRVLAISADAAHAWLLGDRACVNEGDVEIVCGSVIKIVGKAALLKLDTKNDQVARGDKVKYSATRTAKARGNRRPANALMDSVGEQKAAKINKWDITAGLSGGLTFFYPQLHLQRMLSSKISIGIMPLFFSASSGDASVSALGGMLTFNYYGSEYFRGFWVQTGVGAFSFSAKTSSSNESSTSPAGILTLGWRGYWSAGLNIGVGGGIQYIKDPNFNAVDIKAASIQPLVVLDAGFNF